MLGGFRKASKSWPVKVMFGLLTLSFGAWGIGDMLDFQSSTPPGLVVGSDKIPPDEVAKEFQQDLAQIQQMGGQKLSVEDALQLGVLDQTIQRLVSDALLYQSADSLGLAVDDGTLRQNIASIPAFQNDLHQFDLTNYKAALDQAGMSEPQFVELQRDAILRSYVVNAVTGGVSVPAAMLDPLFAYRQEQRVAQTITIPAASMPAPAAPSDGVLQDYYKSHGAAFTLPESRTVTAVVLRTADIAAGIKPTDDEIQQSYTARAGDFSTPEKRSVQQVLFTDQAQAQALVNAVRGGKPFAAAVAATGKQSADLGAVARADLPLPVLADAAFASPGTGIVGPVQSPLGWHVLNVSAITPGGSQPLSQVRDKIVADLVASKAQDQITDLANKVDDTLGSGAGVEEIATKLNLTLLKIPAIDQNGDDANGKPVTNLPPGTAFLQAVFQTAQGSTSDMVEMENGAGYFVLRVDKVTPPALKPYASVKDQVVAAWTKTQQQDAARKLADSDADRLSKGESIAAVAGKYAVAVTDPFTRTGGDSVNPLLAAAIFSAKPGAATVVAVEDDSVVAILKSVLPADSKTQAPLYQQTAQQLGQALTGDIANEYVAALQDQFGVKVNQGAITAQIQGQ